MKKLQCSNTECDGFFSHLLSPKSMDIVRQKQQFIITGKDWTITGTCGKCGQKSTFFVENGKFDESGVTFKEDTPPPAPNPPEPALPTPPPAS